METFSSLAESTGFAYPKSTMDKYEVLKTSDSYQAFIDSDLFKKYPMSADDFLKCLHYNIDPIAVHADAVSQLLDR